ncbi:hypothetical protein protein [Bacillus cereus G9241]|nr:hypothetical protein protein [Bacillus cereus G9241]
MKLYRRFFEYIDKSRQKKETPLHAGVSFFFVPIIYTKRIFFLHMFHFITMPRY